MFLFTFSTAAHFFLAPLYNSYLFGDPRANWINVSRAVSQVIMRVYKPTVAYELVQLCSKNPKGAP